MGPYNLYGLYNIISFGKNMSIKTKNHLFVRIIFKILLSVYLLGCQDSSSDKNIYMALNHVEHVIEFPIQFTLENKTTPSIDIIGIRNFIISHDKIIFSTTNQNGSWSILSLPDYHYFGKFLNQGDGPLEFMQLPSAGSNTTLIKEKEQLVAYLYDFQKGRLMKFNIDESIKSDSSKISVLNDSLPQFLFGVTMIDSAKFLGKKLDNLETQQIRFTYDGKDEITSPIMERLNMASISLGEDFNILSTITKYSKRHNRIVEMPIRLNYINLYSLDEKFEKTICIGNELFNISNIEKKKRWERIYAFSDLRLFDDFFGVVFINEIDFTYELYRYKIPSILLFDWDGNPLAELKLKNHVTSFDIDFVNKDLYTFDVHSDEFFKYDIGDILSKLKSNKISPN